VLHRSFRGKNAYNSFVGKPKDLKEIKLPDVNWIYMAPYVAQWTDFVNTVMGIRLLYKEGTFTVREI